MDEYIHILYESLDLQNVSDRNTVTELQDRINEAISLRTVSQDFDQLKTNKNGRIKIEKNRLRCRYSLRFSKEKNYQDKEVTRQSQVIGGLL